MLTKICALLSKISLIIATFGLGLVILCVLYQVFGRWVLNDTPTWAETLALVLIAYVTMFGTAVGVRDAGHIGMESLLAICPQPYKSWLEIFIHAAVALFGLYMSYYSWLLAMNKWHQNIPSLPLPEGLFNLPLVIAGVLIALFSVEHIVALIKGREIVPSWH